MRNIFRDFISYENRNYPLKIGRTVASSLTGFIVGAVASHIVWMTVINYSVTGPFGL
jgi:riboflavin transporter FmnP